MITLRRWQWTLWSSVLVSLTGVLLVGIVAVSAQATSTPISVGGENKTGDLSTATSGSLDFTLVVDAPRNVIVLLLGITPGFAPAFRLRDSSGTVLVDNANAGAVTSLQAQADLPGSGTYTLEVRSATQVAGQFVLSLQAGAASMSPLALTAGTPISGTVDDQTTQQDYAFSASPSEDLLLTLAGDGSAGDPIVTLRDADTHETLGVSSSRFSGVGYRIPASSANYLVEVAHSDGATAEGFVVCLATVNEVAACPGAQDIGVPGAVPPPADLAATPTEAIVTETTAAIDTNATCQAAPVGSTVNVRVGPGTGAGVVGRLSAGDSAAVTGRTADSSWFQINIDGLTGWVSAAVVTVTGDCSSVAVLNVPISMALPTKVPPAAAPQPTSAPLQPTNPPPTKEPKPTKTPPPPTVDPNHPTFSPMLNPTLANGAVPVGLR